MMKRWMAMLILFVLIGCKSDENERDTATVADTDTDTDTDTDIHRYGFYEYNP